VFEDAVRWTLAIVTFTGVAVLVAVPIVVLFAGRRERRAARDDTP
jgi:ABC-type maltose transport system permease subunit